MPTDEHQEEHVDPSEPRSGFDARYYAVNNLLVTAAKELRDFLAKTQGHQYTIENELLEKRIALGLQVVFFDELAAITRKQIIEKKSIPVIMDAPDTVTLFEDEPLKTKADILDRGKVQAQTMILNKLGVNLPNLTQQMAERTGLLQKVESTGGPKTVRTLTFTDSLVLPSTQITFVYVEGENALRDTLVTLLPMPPTQSPSPERRA